MSREAALKLAEEQNLDLIEVSPLAKPPVARIFSFDKYRYQQEKKLRKQKAGQKDEIKQVQISIRSARHDLEIKADKVNQFLARGYQVVIVVRLRGREKANKGFARQKLNDFLKIISAHKVVYEPKVGGYGIVTQIQKK